MNIEARPHWPVWAKPFLEALVVTADRGRLRPGIASDRIGIDRSHPYKYRWTHDDFSSEWSKVAIYVRALEEQRLTLVVRRSAAMD